MWPQTTHSYFFVILQYIDLLLPTSDDGLRHITIPEQLID